MIDDKIINLFVGTEGRYSIKRSFVQDKWKCATDGRIAIRIPCDEPDTVAKNFRPPQVGAVFKPFDASKCVMPWIKATPKESDCPDCEGYGEVTCETCGNEEECENCNCTGKILERWPVEGHEMKAENALAINQLPNVKYWIPEGDGKPMQFTFDGGGQGLVIFYR